MKKNNIKRIILKKFRIIGSKIYFIHSMFLKKIKSDKFNKKGLIPFGIFECEKYGYKGCLAKRFIAIGLMFSMMFLDISSIATFGANNNDRVVYPLKKISKRECRYQDFSELSSDCKRNLPILKTKDYEKYINKNGGYNDYTRTYSVLWGSSYKYGWDVGHGGHIGTDIATAKGTPVYAMANGKVIIAENKLGFGNLVSIEHEIKGKKVVSNYGHLSKILVKKGQKVNASDKIGEVGSTGNSTGNHLHFQIDLDTPYHPYYYDKVKCPHTYHKITEEGLCFDELNKNTIDPLLFLETSGAVLDNIKVKNVVKKIDVVSAPAKGVVVKKEETKKEDKKKDKNDLSIFDKYVYIGSDPSDIKEVQNVLGNLGEYSGPISGDYKDVEKYILKYQLVNNIIQNKESLGAGYFGPKTRAQALNDYKRFLSNGGEVDDYSKKLKKLAKQEKKNNSAVDTTTSENKETTIVVENSIKTKKISRENILSREEIEAREVESFLNKYNIELNFKNLNSNVIAGESSILKLKITDSRGRLFKGNMPGGMTFVVDGSKVGVFPQKLYNFTDGKRDITISGKSSGSSTLYVKIGNETVKSFKINVLNGAKVVYPTKGTIISEKNIVLSDIKTGAVVFKDNIGNNLVNFKYGGTYKLQASGDIQVCIKKGRDVGKTFKKKCNDPFSDSIDFSYEDTALGILVFDYKVTGDNAKISIINNYNKESFDDKKLVVTDPKGLKNNYEYKDEVLSMLKKGIVDGINKGYFLEKRELTEYDAISWIENTLTNFKEEVIDPSQERKINEYLSQIKKEKVNISRFNTISRIDFLDLTDKYLLFDENVEVIRKYRDLESNYNKKANSVFDEDYTWKDRFGENYFRPKVKMTRGEGAYFLSRILDNNKSTILTVR